MLEFIYGPRVHNTVVPRKPLDTSSRIPLYVEMRIQRVLLRQMLIDKEAPIDLLTEPP